MGSEKAILEFPKRDLSINIDNFEILAGDKFLLQANEIIRKIKDGKSNFGFMTDYYYYSQQKYILTLCVYISKIIDFKITIYSQSIDESYYKTLLMRDLAKKERSNNRIRKITDKIYLIDIGNFNERSTEYFNTLLEPGTIQFWDLPPCEKIQVNKSHYDDFLNQLDHISIVSDRDSNSPKEMERLRKYFLNNHIIFKHSLFKNENKSKLKKFFKEMFESP